MMLFVFLAVLVGPIFVPITNASLLFVHNGVFSLAIVPCIKELNVLIFPLDVFTYLVMSFLMKMFSLLKPYIPMPAPFYEKKSCFYLHTLPLRVPL
jgi:hypothetical protein